MRFLIVMGLVVGGFLLWNYLDDSGYIYHDEITTVYSPDWPYGGYKTCTSLNGSAHTVRNILCDGGVLPSGRVEDGKVFKVRFWGKTYDAAKPVLDPNVQNSAAAVFWWKCRKNESGDPSVTCKQAPEFK